MLLLLVLGTSSLGRADEHIFVCGGPALHYFEKWKPSSHDKYWGNFIDAGLARYPQIKSEIKEGDFLTWLVFRPSYITRSREENSDLLEAVKAKVATTGGRLLWFDSKDQLINYLNSGQDRDKIKIARFEFFGHSNMRCFMFSYSNHIDGAAPDYMILHLDDLKRIKYSSFAENSYNRSWGCHSGEEYSQVWKRTIHSPMIGAIGKTDYSNGGLPILSTPEGKWSQ